MLAVNPNWTKFVLIRKPVVSFKSKVNCNWLVSICAKHWADMGLSLQVAAGWWFWTEKLFLKKEGKFSQKHRKCRLLFWKLDKIRLRTNSFKQIQKIWRALFSWNTRFEIRPFALLPAISERLLTTANKTGECVGQVGQVSYCLSRSMLKRSLNLKYAHESIELAHENKRKKSCGKSQPLHEKETPARLLFRAPLGVPHFAT